MALEPSSASLLQTLPKGHIWSFPSAPFHIQFTCNCLSVSFQKQTRGQVLGTACRALGSPPSGKGQLAFGSFSNCPAICGQGSYLLLGSRRSERFLSSLVLPTSAHSISSWWGLLQEATPPPAEPGLTSPCPKGLQFSLWSLTWLVPTKRSV